MVYAPATSVVRMFCIPCGDDADYLSLPSSDGFDVGERMCAWCGSAVLVDADPVEPPQAIGGVRIVRPSPTRSSAAVA